MRVNLRDVVTLHSYDIFRTPRENDGTAPRYAEW